MELLIWFFLLIVCWPLAILAGIAYAGFWLFSVSVKVVGAVLGVLFAVVFCVFLIGGLTIAGIFFAPFLLVFG